MIAWGILITLVFSAVNFYRHRKNQVLQDALMAPTVSEWLAPQLIIDTAMHADLRQHINQYMRVEGTVCEYEDIGYGNFYVELTAALQTDSGVLVARPLFPTPAAPMSQWSSCDSAQVEHTERYGMRSHPVHVMIQVELVALLPIVDMGRIFLHSPCLTYHGKKRKMEYHLENFCYDNLTFKGRLTAVRCSGDSIWLDFDRGVAMDLRPNRWKWYHPTSSIHAN